MVSQYFQKNVKFSLQAVAERRAGFEKQITIDEQVRSVKDLKKAHASKEEQLRKEVVEKQSSEESLRKALTQAELKRVQEVLKIIHSGFSVVKCDKLKDLIYLSTLSQEANIMSTLRIVEGHSDIPGDVLEKLNMAKGTASKFIELQQAFESDRHEQEV